MSLVKSYQIKSYFDQESYNKIFELIETIGELYSYEIMETINAFDDDIGPIYEQMDTCDILEALIEYKELKNERARK